MERHPGAANEITRIGQSCFRLRIDFEFRGCLPNCSYQLAVECPKEKGTAFRVVSECLEGTGGVIYASDPESGDAAREQQDETHRFLAMPATLLDDEASGLHFFEAIDNGIHPSRLHLLVELIESRTRGRGIQVVTTTHSPDLLALVGDDTFQHTSVVCRRPDSSNAVIRRVADLPNAVELRHSQGFARLHASNWMEDAVYFDHLARRIEAAR